MKRSSMVQLMTNEYHTSLRGGMSEMTDEERMDYLLAAIEEAGMEPPKIKYFNLDKSGKLHYSMRNGELLNMWELEDE